MATGGVPGGGDVKTPQDVAAALSGGDQQINLEAQGDPERDGLDDPSPNNQGEILPEDPPIGLHATSREFCTGYRRMIGTGDRDT